MTDAFIAQLAKKITEDVTRQVNTQWGIVISELAKTRETSNRLAEQLDAFKATLNSQSAATTEQLSEVHSTVQLMRENNRKASEILRKASKELGLSE